MMTTIRSYVREHMLGAIFTFAVIVLTAGSGGRALPLYGSS